ncbi:MAG: hypothetical protein AAB631_00365 [Patescibacteria group bacterium]
MTIIKPHKNPHFRIVFVGFFVVMALGAGFYIFGYTALANLKFQTRELKKELETLRVENADLAMSASSLRDPQKLQTLAKEKGFTQERRPEYLRVNQWLSASSL